MLPPSWDTAKFIWAAPVHDPCAFHFKPWSSCQLSHHPREHCKKQLPRLQQYQTMVCPLQIHTRSAVELMTTTLMPRYARVESFALPLWLLRCSSYDGAGAVKLRHLRPSETFWDSLLQLKGFAVVINCREHMAVPGQPGRAEIPSSGPGRWERGVSLPALASKDGRLAAALRDASERTLPAPAQVSINPAGVTTHECSFFAPHVTPMTNTTWDPNKLRSPLELGRNRAQQAWCDRSSDRRNKNLKPAHQIPSSVEAIQPSDLAVLHARLSYYNRKEGDVCVCIYIYVYNT